MFDYEPKIEKSPPDYTGVIIMAALAPLFFVVTYIETAEMGLATCTVLGMAIFVVKLRWELRKHVWFWATLVILLALHMPLIQFARAPQFKANPAIYVFPLGVVDFAIFFLIVGFVEDVVSRFSPSSDD